MTDLRALAPHLVLPLIAVLALPAMDGGTWITLTVAGVAMGMMLFLMASGLTLIFGMIKSSEPYTNALATARTHSLLAAHHPIPDAIVGGFTRALLAATFFTGAVVLIGLRAANTKGEPPGGTSAEITGVAIPGEVKGTGKFPAHSDEETTFHA